MSEACCRGHQGRWGKAGWGRAWAVQRSERETPNAGGDSGAWILRVAEWGKPGEERPREM